MTEKPPQNGFTDELCAFPGLDRSVYEYPADRKMIRVLDSLLVVKMLARGFLGLIIDFYKGEQLGQSVRVSERQFPELHRLVLKTAEILDMEPPAIFVGQNPHVNAHTFGMDDEQVFVVLSSSLVDLLEPRELLFVLGHELGHIKSNHTLYHTLATWVARGVTAVTPPLLDLLSLPAALALQAWKRRSEITCDRAGLLVCQDENMALKALVKLALGAHKLLEQIDLDEYIDQIADLNKSYGRFSEVFATHPFLPKRVQALRLFAHSDVYVGMVCGDVRVRWELEEVNKIVENLLGGETLKDKPGDELLQDEEVLSVLAVLACAWSDGELSAEDRQNIRDLLDEYAFPEEVLQSCEKFFTTPLTFDDLAYSLRLFEGEKENVFLAALEYVFRRGARPSRRRRNLLYRLGELCGLDATAAIETVGRREKTMG
jgi:Zn-dependent protease with chaperone function